MDLRTETEVAEAFFSASNGNMEMLNNMLGEKYNNMDEAMAGIAKNQGGLVEEMSTTLGGLMSTISGKFKVGIKEITKLFGSDLSNAFNGIISLIDNLTPKIVEFTGKIINGFKAFAQSEQANQYMQIFKSVAEFVFNAIKSVIDAVSPTIKSIFNFIGQHSQQISAIVETLGKVWGTVWNTIGILLKGAWDICSPILSAILKAVEKVSGAVQSVCEWWDKMSNMLKTPINATVNVVKKGMSAVGDFLGLNSRSAYGTKRVARNDTPYRLHEGERVLTKQEANALDRGVGGNGGISINIANLQVREEADITKIAKELVRELRLTKQSFGGVY